MHEVAVGAVRVGRSRSDGSPAARPAEPNRLRSQDAFLFSATVAENIGFGAGAGDGGAESRARVKRAAEAAGLAPDLAVFPDGYDTLVGERGLTLSGRQRQRVALARALAADPKILILDDSLSSVDAQTEREILTPAAPHPGGSDVDPDLAPGGRGEGRRPDPGAGTRGAWPRAGTHAELVARGRLYASLYRTELDAEALAGEGAA